MKSLKVVQGLEAEYTNQFLIALAECCTDNNLDWNEAVRRCLAGEAPGQNPPPLKRVSLCYALTYFDISHRLYF